MRRLRALLSVGVCLGLFLGWAAAQERKAASRPAQKHRPEGAGRPTRWVNPLRNPPPGAEHKTYGSDCMGHDVGYVVYTPPDYASSGKRYPVIYWLHGAGGNETGPGRRIAEFVQKAVVEKRIEPVIMVFVNGGRTSGYTDDPEKKIMPETAIIKELIPLIDRTYRTIPSRQGRAIEGFSMGGAGAVKFAFKYPELFGSVISYAGAMHYPPGAEAKRTETQPAATRPAGRRWDSVYLLARQNAEKVRGKVRIRLVVGTRDPTLKYNEPFRALLEELKIPHEYEVLEGLGHRAPLYYERIGDKGFHFHEKAFKASGQTREQGKDKPQTS